jgi:hypothetical protein
MTVAEFQRYVERQEGLTDCHLRLYHKERKLQQNKTLREVKVQDNDFLVLKKVQRRVPDTSPTGSTSSRSQEKHHFVTFQQPHSSVSLPAANQTMQSGIPRLNQEDDDEADDEEDEGPQGRLVMDEDEDSATDNSSRKISGASSTATIREDLNAFSLERQPETTQLSAFSQLAQTAAEEHMKMEAAGQLGKLSESSQIARALYPQLAFPYGLPPVYRLVADRGTPHLPNAFPQQLPAASIPYLLTNPYAATLLNPGIIRHPYLAVSPMYDIPPLLAVSQCTGVPSITGFRTDSVYQRERSASDTSPTQVVSPTADSTVLSTQGNSSSSSVSSSTMSQSDKRRRPSAASSLYNSLPKNPLQWNPEHVQRWLHALSLKHGLHELDSSRFKMNGRGLALMKLKGFQYRLGEYGVLAYEDLNRLMIDAQT